MNDNEHLLGDNVGYLIDELKILSRAELASAMGVSTQAVGQLIRSETKGLRPTNLIRASRKLGVAAENLVMEDLRRRPDLLGPKDHPRDAVAEPGVSYGLPLSARIQAILHKIYIAAVQNRLTESAVDYLERTVDMLATTRR